jgi:hypothetical protein
LLLLLLLLLLHYSVLASIKQCCMSRDVLAG